MLRSERLPVMYWVIDCAIAGESRRVRTGVKSGWKKDRGARCAMMAERTERGRGRRPWELVCRRDERGTEFSRRVWRR